MIINDILIILPEIILIVAALIGLLLGVFNEQRSMAIVKIVSYIGLLSALGIILHTYQAEQFVFNKLLVINDFTQFIKAIILSASLVVLFISQQQSKQDKLDRFEYSILILFAIVGMMFMVSANNLMMFFIGLELQSLSLYILIAFKRDDVRAAEGSIKYFVLGTLATIFILYGSSLIYGSTHSTDFTIITQWLDVTQGSAIAVMVGIVMIIAGSAFKISLAPFHMWTPDVYQGGPISVIAFLSSVPKIAGMAIFTRLILVVFYPVFEIINPLVIALALLSMIIGTFAALFQQNIQRLIAYSTISHMGYAVLGLCGGHPQGAKSLLIYLIIYVITIVTLFVCLMCLKRNDKIVEDITDLTGLSRANPLLAAILTVVLFSFAGIPPFMGFFAKYAIFSSMVVVDYYSLALLSLLISVAGAAYYLRVVKIMYFDVLPDNVVALKYDQDVPGEALCIAVVGLIFITGYILKPGWIDHTVFRATAALCQSL